MSQTKSESLESMVKKLPSGVTQLINEFLQDEYHRKYDNVVKYINKLLTKNKKMMFKKKFRVLFGDEEYSIYDYNCYGPDDYRICSIRGDCNGFNSIQLQPAKILLSMELSEICGYCDCDLCECNQDDYDDFKHFREYCSGAMTLANEIMLAREGLTFDDLIWE